MAWWFLLPIAATSSSISDRNHYKKTIPSLSRYFYPDCLKGLNYFLNGQPDKTIDVFIHLFRVGLNTILLAMLKLSIMGQYKINRNSSIIIRNIIRTLA